MRDVYRSFAAALVLILTLNSAEAATAGHMFRSAASTGQSDQDVTGSIKKPSSTDGSINGAAAKPAPIIAKPKVAPAH